MLSQTEEIHPVKRARYRAQCIVCGMRTNGKTNRLEPDSGSFSDRFLPHPYVRESVFEGWDAELRHHLIHTITVRILRNEPTDHIDDLMPPRDWVESAKHNAERYAKAAEWRKANPRRAQPLKLSFFQGRRDAGDAA